MLASLRSVLPHLWSHHQSAVIQKMVMTHPHTSKKAISEDSEHPRLYSYRAAQSQVKSQSSPRISASRIWVPYMVQLQSFWPKISMLRLTKALRWMRKTSRTLRCMSSLGRDPFLMQVLRKKSISEMTLQLRSLQLQRVIRWLDCHPS